MDHRLKHPARNSFVRATKLLRELTSSSLVEFLKMSDPISITLVIAKKVCGRLERALGLLESVDESGAEDDLVEIASAIYEAQQTLLRVALSLQVVSNSPSSTTE